MADLPESQFKELVARAPLVSIDLLIRNAAGEVLLGLRRNHPAKDFWFVPGRRIRKGETIEQALIEACKRELGRSVDLQAVNLAGIFHHFYPEIFSGDSDSGTHYVVLLHEVDVKVDTAELPVEQHSKYTWMTVDELGASSRVHQNVKKFFSDREVRVSTEKLLQLYPVYQAAISYYTNIVWAFPATLVAMNAFLVQALPESPIPLLILAVFNFALLQVFFKLAANERAIIQSLRRLESLLRIRFSFNGGSSLVPHFDVEYNWFTKPKSANLLANALLVLTFLNLLWAINRCWSLSGLLSTMKTFIGCSP